MVKVGGQEQKWKEESKRVSWFERAPGVSTSDVMIPLFPELELELYLL